MSNASWGSGKRKGLDDAQMQVPSGASGDGSRVKAANVARDSRDFAPYGASTDDKNPPMPWDVSPERKAKGKGEVWEWPRIGTESWILAKQLAWRLALDGWKYRTFIVLGVCVGAILGVLVLYLVLNLISKIELMPLLERVPLPQGDLWRWSPADMMTWLTTVMPQIKYIGVFWAWLPGTWKEKSYETLLSLGSFPLWKCFQVLIALICGLLGVVITAHMIGVLDWIILSIVDLVPKLYRAVLRKIRGVVEYLESDD